MQRYRFFLYASTIIYQIKQLGKSPISTMPQATHQKYDKGIADDFGFGGAATSQGNVDIVTKPGGERNMPATPELGYVTAEIRHIEVAHQLNAKQFGTTYRYIGIAGKITIYLKGEENGSQQQGTAALVLIGIKHLIDIDSTIVSYDYLLEKAPQHLATTVNSLRIIEGARTLELRQKIGGTFNRTRYQLREETDIGQKGYRITCRCQLLAIDIYAIGQGLKGIEGDAHRQYNMQGGGLECYAKGGKGIDKALHKEVEVFEEAQYAQIEEDIRPQIETGITQDIAALGYIGIFLYQQSARPTEQRSESNEQKEAPVPPSVKDIGRHHHKCVLPLQTAVEHKPIEQKHYRQKQKEFKGIE